MTAGIISGSVITASMAAVGAMAGGTTGALVLGAVGLALGFMYGRAIVVSEAYDFASSGGIVAFVVDHTWSLLNTVAGALYLTGNLVFGNRIDRAQSRHSNTVALTNGVFPGYATTIGPVEAGVTPTIAVHEAVHVFQARLFGFLYLPLVVLNYIIATILPYWLIYHDKAGHPIGGFRDYFEKGVYPHVWNEAWAYRVEGTPP
ncbi:MAG: glycine zipper family protein [Acidimicrobiia bacterium]